MSVFLAGCGGLPASEKERRQVLFDAIRSHDLAAVQTIVETGDVDLDPPYQPNQINKALAYATIFGNLEIVQYILAQGVDIDGRVSYYGTALLRASEMGHYDMAEFLIRSGADVNAANAFGISAVAGYSLACNTQMLGMALEYGGNIDQAHVMTVSNAYGELAYNPIQWAVLKGNMACVQFLVEHGADLNVISRDDETLLEMADREGHDDIRAYLTNHY
ncbi:hypothetical protein BGP77_03915 [Saccharospirillum sp. MSK14-1]|nr:hypothetical protein BGP77_03915 [Saccharospirillum sp. MSK14-1]